MNTIVKSDLKDQLLAFADSSELPGLSFPDLKEKRQAALERFSAVGFPGKKDEEYKYANIRPLLKGDFTLTPGEHKVDISVIKNITADLENAIRIVFVNGVFVEDLSNLAIIDGMSLKPFSDAIADEELRKLVGQYSDTQDPFNALNTALWTEGLMLHLSGNCNVDRPIYCIHVATSDVPRINQKRLLIVLEEGASATFIEHYETVDLSAVSFTNQVTEIVMKEDAILHHYILQNECENGALVNSTNTCLDGKATYHINTVTLNGAFVRNNLTIVLNHPYAEAHLYGFYAANGNSLVDNHTLVDHRVRDCQSNELYKGIIDDKATGVFNGKIFVRQDAQKTNAFQSNKNILLSDDASMNTKPQLEIYADDVKCSHGSSTGEINQEALFYLRSRGLSPESARKLMIQAFADDVLNNIKQEDFRNYVSALVSTKLS